MSEAPEDAHAYRFSPAERPPNALEAALRALGEAGVTVVVIRDYEPGEAVIEVDVLVPARDRARVRTTLGGVGFAPLRAWGHGAHRFFLTYSAPDRRWVKLDVVSRLAGTDPAPILAGRRAPGVLPRPAARVEAALLLLHVALEKDGRAGRHSERLHRVAADPPPPPAGMATGLEALWSPAWAAIAETGPGALEPIAAAMRSRIRPRPSAPRRLWARAARHAYYLRRAVRPAVPTLLVTGVGPGERALVDRLAREIGHPLVHVRPPHGRLAGVRLTLRVEHARRRVALPVLVDAAPRHTRLLRPDVHVDLERTAPERPTGAHLASLLWQAWRGRLSR